MRQRHAHHPARPAHRLSHPPEVSETTDRATSLPAPDGHPTGWAQASTPCADPVNGYTANPVIGAGAGDCPGENSTASSTYRASHTHAVGDPQPGAGAAEPRPLSLTATAPTASLGRGNSQEATAPALSLADPAISSSRGGNSAGSVGDPAAFSRALRRPFRTWG